MSLSFSLQAPFQPAGDQPRAISALVRGLRQGQRHNVLLGVTGSGKTFTAAHVIASLQKPTLVIAHNKTLAAQLAQEYRTFFPRNAVHYFVSYYDYYQPEAYIAATDTYIEKDAQINEEIDRLRHAATQALLTRRDVIIVASVSCIYGLGSPEEYVDSIGRVRVGTAGSPRTLMRELVRLYYERTTADLKPGYFRSIGGTVEVMGSSSNDIYRIEYHGDKVKKIFVLDGISRHIKDEPEEVVIFPAKHFVTSDDVRRRAIQGIRQELDERLNELKKQGKELDAERLRRRTLYDIAMIEEVGYCTGIENYARHFSGRAPGEPPDTLLSYFPKDKKGHADFLTIIDESHVTIPQLRGMYAGDAARKKTLIEYGFRLPSACDNRPLTFSEFMDRVGQIIYTSATPGPYEIQAARQDGQVVEQIIRPTGLLDPLLEVRPVTPKKGYGGQVDDVLKEIEYARGQHGRSLVTTLTKKMAEDLAAYVSQKGIKARYIHSDIKTLDRISILTDFRKGSFDCLIGVNLLREGLDLPEVSFVGILDSDKEGFLRSETSLIQIIGRAARNAAGKVVLYADEMVPSLQRAIEETNRRRKIQEEYNKKHGITPRTILKKIEDITSTMTQERSEAARHLVELEISMTKISRRSLISQKKKEMIEAVKRLDFETAAVLRDEIRYLESLGGKKNERKQAKKS